MAEIHGTTPARVVSINVVINGSAVKLPEIKYGPLPEFSSPRVKGAITGLSVNGAGIRRDEGIRRDDRSGFHDITIDTQS